MIKIDGVDIPRIEYIDTVDGKVSILRVMQDGLQIWPINTPPVIPNIPTGIQLSEYEIAVIPNIPTGIELSEYEITDLTDYDLTTTYDEQTNYSE